MAEQETVARPYAEAAFDIARDNNALAEWSNALQAVAAVVENPDGAALIHDPLIQPAKRAEIIIDIVGDDLGDDSKNLVRLLAEKSRLELAPVISTAYAALYAAEQNTLDVDVTSASGLNDEQSEKLKSALEKRLGKTIRLHVTEDENVVGGAIIRAGDLVFDHTIAGQLDRMHQHMAR